MAERTCSVPECTASAIARDLCHKHYMRWHRTGSALAVGKSGPKPRPKATCNTDDCAMPVRANGLCGMHAQRVLRYGSIELPARPAPPPFVTCRACTETLPRHSFASGRRVCKLCTSKRNREWRRKNWVALREREDAYRRANQALINLRARKRVGRGAFSKERLDARIAYYGGLCWICRAAPYEHLDHVKPIAAGGPNLLANIRPACAACNLSKGAKWPFAREEVVA